MKLTWRSAALGALILAGAAFLRLYGIDWDRGYLFHPDERQILLVADYVRFPWPPQPTVLLSAASPWNPRFFSYGSLPVYLLRYVASLAGLIEPTLSSLWHSYLVGRALAALFDLGTVAITFLLGRRLYGARTGWLAAALVGGAVLHIQLAHFYVVDAPLAFFSLLTVYLVTGLGARPSVRQSVALGIAWGCALATKVSAAPLAVPVAVGWVLAGELTGRERLRGVIYTGLVALAVFLLWEPYALIDVHTFWYDVTREAEMASGALDAPYTRQYIGAAPYLYLIWQTAVWGLGLPLGVAGFGGLVGAAVWAVRGLVRRQGARHAGALVVLSWFVIYFGLTGALHAKFLRYMLPMTPLLCLWAAWGLDALWRWARRRTWTTALAGTASALVLGSTLLYAVAYLHIYSVPHPWIQTTAWLCENLPKRTPILTQHWDDPLPLSQGTGELDCYADHYVTDLLAYEDDDTAKLDHLLRSLRANDYIVLASNRLYDTIPRLPQRYPLTSRYYQLLLGEQLGFELVYSAASYPTLFGIELVDDTFSDPPLPVPALLARQAQGKRQLVLGRADESFTVYDHPKTLVFRRREILDYEQLRARLGTDAMALPAPQGESPY